MNDNCINLQTAIDRLHAENCSCVIVNGSRTFIGHQRGVKDLYGLVKGSPEILDGAYIADKVVGKGAAALMVIGGVKGVFADVISEPALDLFDRSGVSVSYGICVPNIIRRDGNGICPVESLCADCSSTEECLPLIENFINNINSNENK